MTHARHGWIGQGPAPGAPVAGETLATISRCERRDRCRSDAFEVARTTDDFLPRDLDNWWAVHPLPPASPLRSPGTPPPTRFPRSGADPVTSQRRRKSAPGQLSPARTLSFVRGPSHPG